MDASSGEPTDAHSTSRGERTAYPIGAIHFNRETLKLYKGNKDNLMLHGHNPNSTNIREGEIEITQDIQGTNALVDHLTETDAEGEIADGELDTLSGHDIKEEPVYDGEASTSNDNLDTEVVRLLQGQDKGHVLNNSEQPLFTKAQPDVETPSISSDADSHLQQSSRLVQSQSPRIRKNSSKIWTVMTKTKTNVATCTICYREFKCGQGTANLIRHVKTRHPELNVDAADSEKKLALDEKLLALVCNDLQSFSIVEDAAFKEFCIEMNPSYVLPRRCQLKRLLSITYEKQKRTLIDMFTTVDYVAITIDPWTSMTAEIFFSVTAHYFVPTPSWNLRSTILATCPQDEGSTATGMSDIIQDVFTEFGIGEKVISATTNNSQMMVNLVRDHLRVVHVECFAHALNLIARDAIAATTGLTSLIKEVKDVVSFFHKSTRAARKLKEFQKNTNTKELKLCQEVPTRWNSILKMFQRFSDLHKLVKGVLKCLHRHDLIVSDQKVNFMRETCESLKAFEEATELMSTAKRMHLSQTLVIVHQLQSFLSTESAPTELVYNLLRELSNRFPTPENNFTVAATTLLDPRFRRIPFTDQVTRVRHEEDIVNLMRPLSKSEEASTPETTEDEDVAPPPLKKSFMQSFLNKVKQMEETAPEQLTGPQEEFKRYMNMSHLDYHKDPINWWQEHAAQFPHLCKIARKYMIIPATSVPSGQLFSKAGELFLKRRSCLSTSTIDMVLFMNQK